MHGDAKVIEYLNRAVRAELTAMNQYWLHYRVLDNLGFKDLARKWRAETLEIMEHVDGFAARILFLDGFPDMQTLDPLRVGRTVEEVIDASLATELGARALYLEAAAYCMQINDRGTMMLFEETARTEEGHIDLLEQQLKLIKQLGAELYSQKRMGELAGSETL